MKKKLLTVAGLIFLILFAAENMFAQESFYVYFMQNGTRINVKKTKIELKKQPFKIYVEYTAPVDLLVYASKDSKTWSRAEKGKLLEDMPVFNETEEKKQTIFNFKKTLVLNPEVSYLWGKNESDTTINLVSQKGRRINVKTVNSIYSMPDTTTVFPQNYDKDIYMVFIYPGKYHGERVEYQREVIKIIWVKRFDKETKSYQRKKKAAAKEKVRTAKQQLKRKQKAAKKEEKRLNRLKKDEIKRLEKEKKKAEKEKRKKDVDKNAKEKK
ncbi:MAG: hypothetical protein L3J56_09730 [Bacteroidales bacterium]|nr:hypothetical protein [Bacteroidales bacterium]